MVRLTELFHWMFEDERWRYKILFQGLLLLVPVVGLIALLGWMMIICDSLRAGRQDLAPAGLHLRRGVRLFAIGIVYWVGLGLPYTVLRALDARWGDVLPFGMAAQVYNDLALFLFALLIVPVFVAVDRGGFLAGLRADRVASAAASRPLRTLVAGLLVIVAVAIGILGFAVIVAAPFTITYGAAIVAGVAAWWSRPSADEEEGEGEPEATAAAGGVPAPFRPPDLEPTTGGWTPTVRP